MKLQLKGVITVEMSLIMPVILLAFAICIRTAFLLYDDVLAGAVLNEAVEAAGHAGDEENGAAGAEFRGSERMRAAAAGKYSGIRIEEYGNGCSASVRIGAVEKTVRDKGFRPEKLMRKLTLPDMIARTEKK